MTPSLDEDLKRRIVVWYFKDGLTYRDIRDLAGCSIGLVAKVLSNYRTYGEVNNPFSKRTGRPTTVDDGDVDYITALLEANPTLYLDEIQTRLQSARQKFLSISTLARLLIRYGLTRKVVRKSALERNEELRDLWEADMAQYADPDVFVFLDESAVDNHTVQRTHGRSMSGTPCVRRATFLRGTRYSILPALTVDGIIALDIFEGSVTKDRFLTFIQEQVCPQLNPWPQKRSVVVLDNCSIHHDEELRRLIIDECGARLIYLPPYSPDFNPIEEAFAAIKASLRRHEQEFVNGASLQYIIHCAANSISPDDAMGWFGDCGYM